MAMIDIEYRHSIEPSGSDLRRSSIKEMHDYINDLVCEMQMADISCKLIDSVSNKENEVLINGVSVLSILDGLEIKMEEPTEANMNKVLFDRPWQDWNKSIIEDIPDILMKNAISKVYGDLMRNKVM